jgi:hypothetical protein
MEKKNATTVCLSGMRKISTLVILFFSFSILSGQESDKEIPALKDRLFYGGHVALQFGTITNIEIAPIIGLWVLPKLAIAAGPSYIYYKDMYGANDIWGGRTYAQYVIIRDVDKFIPLGVHTSLCLHLEDEMLSLDSRLKDSNSVSGRRFMVNTVLGGLAISQQIGRRSAINLMILWTLNDPGYQVYSNPEIRIGFAF